MVSFPYYSHIFRDSNMGVGLGNSMGPAYHKGVPFLGVPENPIDMGFACDSPLPWGFVGLLVVVQPTWMSSWTEVIG